MSNSSKKRKKKRTDFQKVKLKVGRRLPRGQNVTNTTFKTKKIKIREQAREIAPPSHNVTRKTNLKDMLSTLNNQNITQRQNAISGLKNLLNNDKSLISLNLSDLLSKISKLIVDKISDVRSTAQQVLKIILSSATSKQIEPIFPTLSAYLNCGMTHIDQEIQRDSLKFMDVILDHFPGFLTESNSQILTNFLAQISHESKTKSKSESSRTLLVNPDLRWTGQAWRFSVLQRVQKFLASILKNAMSSKKQSVIKVQQVQWNHDLKYQTIPHPNTVLGMDTPFGSFKMSTISTQSTKGNILESTDEMQMFVSNLFPLLIETWVEASPVQYVKNIPANCLPAGSLETLVCLVEIIKIMLDLIDNVNDTEKMLLMKQWFKNSFEKKFMDHFMKKFPYSHQAVATKRKKAEENRNNLQVHCYNLNLAICNVYYRLVSENNSQKKTYCDNVVSYLVKLLKTSTNKLPPNSKTIVELVSIISQDKTTRYSIENLLSELLTYSYDTEIQPKQKVFVNSLFCTIALELTDGNFSSTALDKWMTTLPVELVESKYNSEVVSVLHKLCSQKNEALINALQTKKRCIVDGLAKIHKESGVERKLIEILLHMKYFDKADYEILAQFVKNEKMSIEFRSYTIEVLNLRYQTNALSLFTTETASFISFLLTLIIGNILSTDKEETLKLPFNINVIDQDVEDWYIQDKIVSTVCTSFKQFENFDQLQDTLCNYFVGLLSSRCNLTFKSAWSILMLFNELSLTNLMIHFDEANFIQFVLSVMYAEVVHCKYWETMKMFTENKLLSFKSITTLISISNGLEGKNEVNHFCQLMTNILKQWSFQNKFLDLIEEIVEILKLKLGSSFNDSISWNALSYELSLKR